MGAVDRAGFVARQRAGVRRAFLVALLACLLAGGARASTASPQQCLKALEGVADEASVDWDQRCPGLTAWLEQRGYRGALQPPLSAIERADRARQALRLLTGAARERPAATVDRAALETLVAEIRRADDAPDEAAWWSRLEAWLSRYLPDPDSVALPAWLEGALEALGWLGRLLLWLGYLLLAVLAGLVVWAAGRWLRRHGPRPGPRGRGPDRAATPREAEPLDLERIRRLPQQQQPAAWLRYTVGVLRRAGALPQGPGLTDRELAAALRGADDEARQRFERLVEAAERSVYAERAPGPERLERCVGDARALVHALGARA